MELVSRGLQQYTEAYTHGADAPNLANTEHFFGISSSPDLVHPEMRSYASRLKLLPQLWLEVFLAAQEVTATKVKGNGKKDGRGCGARQSP